jgi:DNA-directed RNA polymerase specialized sigma24 family protein
MIDPKAGLAKYARHGSESAFRNLVNHYGGLVFNSALKRVSDPDLAEETAQNVFAHLSRKATQVLKYRSISAWLFETTASNPPKPSAPNTAISAKSKPCQNPSPTAP